MQIDAIRITDNTVTCNLYTGDRCVRIVMALNDYEALKRDGFFLRPRDKEDSAGVINTTAEFDRIEYADGHKRLA